MPKQIGENIFVCLPRDHLVDSAQPANLTITINLLNGDRKNHDDLGAIFRLLDNERFYEWKVRKDLEDSRSMPKGHIYRLKITNDKSPRFEYSPLFMLRVLASRFNIGSAVKVEVNSASWCCPTGAQIQRKECRGGVRRRIVEVSED